MRCPERSADEVGRLAALAEYGIDPALGLPGLQPIVEMAARTFDCPAAAVNMIGDDHVFFAASEGVGACDMSRDASFCAHAINAQDILVVEDATLDPRFHDNPLVADGLIRFYAGAALRSPSGHALGALCVLDPAPRAGLSPEERARLRALADLVSDKLELRRLGVQAATRPNRFAASAATSPNAVICFDAGARVTAWNAAASMMFGHDAAAMIGEPIDSIIDPRDHPLVHAAIARVRGGGTPVTEATPLTGVRADGTRFPGEIHWSHWFENGVIHFGTIVRDMTEAQAEHDALYRLANYDALTGLPNRNLLRARLAEAAVAGAPHALLVADLAGFGDVNNALGQAAGDAVLGEIGTRLGTLVTGSDMAARCGGAAFALLVAADALLAIDALAEAMIAAIAAPIHIDGVEHRLSGHVGIALAPDHGGEADALIGSAELALFQARQLGPGSRYVYVPALRAEAVARRMYDAELHRAFEAGEFCLFYQPQFCLADGALTGAEALIRWKHPERGLLEPAAFLAALEAGPLAAPVARWVVEEASVCAAFWRARAPDFRMGINLSAALFRAGDLPQLVRGVCARRGLAPSALELEITENILIEGEAPIVEQLGALRDQGVHLAFDDFGTGFASLNLLRTLPVTHIKIDKSFTRMVRSAPRERIIVTTLIDMARRLGISVIAEGVETAEDAAFLREQGCEEGQGYWFGPPVPPALFEELYFANAGTLREIGGSAG